MHDIMALCDVVRQTGFEFHRYLGGGMLEKVYENGSPIACASWV